MDKLSDKTLVLIAGGGCTQIENAIGCIKAIEQVDGSTIDECWGTSAGAIVAGMTMTKGIRGFEDIIRNTPITKWFTLCPWQLIKSLFGKSNYIADNTGLKEALLKYCSDMDSSKVKVSISEMVDGKFVKSELVPGKPWTVLASMSFQHVFPPVKIDGKIYGDGGINDNIPLPRFVDIPKYKRIYLILAPVSPLMPSFKKWPLADRILNLIDNTMNRELAQIEQLHLDDLQHVTVLKPEKWVDSASFLNWSKNFEQIDASFEYAVETLNLRSNRATFPVLPNTEKGG